MSIFQRGHQGKHEFDSSQRFTRAVSVALAVAMNTVKQHASARFSVELADTSSSHSGQDPTVKVKALAQLLLDNSNTTHSADAASGGLLCNNGAHTITN